METFIIKAIFGEAECKAASRGLPHEYSVKEFDTQAEAIAYMRGINDANGWEHASVLTDGSIDMPDDLNDLWEIKESKE